MDRDRFRRLVQRAVRSLPPELSRYLDNVEVVVHREPALEDLRGTSLRPHEAGDAHADRPDETLFGLYVGVPLTERLGGGSLPDRIVIYQGPLERHVPPSQLAREVRLTVMHELAHHFGIDDARLHELGLG